MQKNILKVSNQNGQVLLEFLLTFSLAIGILFLYIQLAINSASGFLAHYFTFAAARVYLVHDTGGEESSASAAEEATQKKFKSFNIAKYKITNFVFKVNKIEDVVERYQQLFVGVFLKFQRKISLFRIITGDKTVSYISEGFLGKEPTRRACLKSICDIMVKKTKNADCSGLNNGHYVLEDNGC